MKILRLLRLKHWVKNLFLFVPLFFAGNAFDFNRYLPLATGFVAFGLIASAIYVLNDLRDYEADKLHPEKRRRPIPAGEVSFGSAGLLMAVLAVAGLSLSWWVNSDFFLLVALYLVINIAYSFGVKNVSIVDIFFVSAGFLIRIYAGGILGEVPVSHWLSIMVLLLSLFLALAKRRDDLVLSVSGVVVRKSSRHYNLEFINSCLSIFAGILIVAYVMYTVSPEVTDHFNTEWLFSTAVFVIAGIMRYLQITFVDQKSGSPTKILYKDKFILITIACWILSFYFIIYTS